MDFFPIKFKWMIIPVGIICLTIIGVLVFLMNGKEAESTEENWTLPWEVGEEERATEEWSVVEKIFVDIKGEVNLPGIYEMDDGGRVFQAIEKAGGFTSEAEENVINLAEKCYDEMVIYVPSKEEVEAGGMMNSLVIGGGQDDSIRVNQATAEELTKLPGIGPAKAEAIVRYREENGPFKTAGELINVPGIGEKTLAAIEELIKVP